MSIIFHELEPFYNKDSEILILGSLPSVKSREMKFYYAHPQNRFWNTLAKVYNEPKPNTFKDKKDFLIKRRGKISWVYLVRQMKILMRII